jgi:23S rRNA (guanosine2251-2'-O)-methyltransferase
MRKLKNKELGRMTVEQFKTSEKNPVVIILDNVRSMHNVGSIFRTSDAFAIEKIYLCGITAQPPHREIEKTALGATNSVEWKYAEHTSDVVKELKEKGYHVYSIEQVENSISLDDFNPGSEKLALIFGNEVEGVSEEVVRSSDGVIEIPQFGTKHSFNIVVSTGIVLWDIFVKLKKLNG